jgi:NRPS condensation-like uncharacterized protein
MFDELYRRVFPLYVNAFERFMQADDRPHYPMCFVITMDFFGQLQRPAFEAAIRQTLDRHRILQCLMEHSKKNRLCWVHHPELFPYLNWGKLGEQLDCPQGDYINLRNEIGLRIWVRQGAERVEITFYFHHSCVDGIAAHRFMGDFAANYTNQLSPDQPAKLNELRPELLKTRTRRQHLAGQSSDHPHTRWYAIKYLMKMTILGTDAIRRPRRKYSAELLSPRFGVYWQRFDQDDYKRLRDAAIQLGVTVNDILVAQTFRTLFAWNEKQSKNGRRREVRILMPVDLRNRGDDVMPCTNMASYNFLTRHPRQMEGDPVKFLQAIRKETAEIKARGMGSAFIDAIERAATRNFYLRMALPSFRCTATVVLTNVGDPTRRWTATLPRTKGEVHCHDLRLDDMTGCPPLRPNTNVTIAITTYLRRLTVGFRCDPHFYTQQDTEEILQHYMEGIREWIRLAEAETA